MAVAVVNTTTATTITPVEDSWEAMEYAGLPQWTVKNTFIDCPVDRSYSLEEFMQLNEQRCKSCPGSGVAMHAKLLQTPQPIPEDSEGSTTDDQSPRADVAEDAEEAAEPWENIVYGELPEWTTVKNTFIDCPADRSASLDEFIKMNEKNCKSCPTSGVMLQDPSSPPLRSYTIFEDEVAYVCTPETLYAAPLSAPGLLPPTQLFDDDRVVLNLAPILPSLTPVVSVGSQGHQFGQCKPCGFVHKEGGCTKGASCPFCHLCPPGTIKEQKHMKKQVRKVQKMEYYAQRNRMNSRRHYY